MLASPVVYLTDNGMVQVAVNHPYPTCTVHIYPSYVDNGAIGDRNGEDWVVQLELRTVLVMQWVRQSSGLKSALRCQIIGICNPVEA